jgi:hypothetical protein
MTSAAWDLLRKPPSLTSHPPTPPPWPIPTHTPPPAAAGRRGLAQAVAKATSVAQAKDGGSANVQSRSQATSTGQPTSSEVTGVGIAGAGQTANVDCSLAAKDEKIAKICANLGQGQAEATTKGGGAGGAIACAACDEASIDWWRPAGCPSAFYSGLTWEGVSAVDARPRQGTPPWVCLQYPIAAGPGAGRAVRAGMWGQPEGARLAHQGREMAVRRNHSTITARIDWQSTPALRQAHALSTPPPPSNRQEPPQAARPAPRGRVPPPARAPARPLTAA